MRYHRREACRRSVALLAEGVGRNNDAPRGAVDALKSPSSRRAWVEIRMGADV